MMGKGITEPAVFNLTTHAPLKAVSPTVVQYLGTLDRLTSPFKTR